MRHLKGYGGFHPENESVGDLFRGVWNSLDRGMTWFGRKMRNEPARPDFSTVIRQRVGKFRKFDIIVDPNDFYSNPQRPARPAPPRGEPFTIRFYHVVPGPDPHRLIAIISDKGPKLAAFVMGYESEMPEATNVVQLNLLPYANYLSDDDEQYVDGQAESPYGKTDNLMAKNTPQGLAGLMDGVLRWWYKNTRSGRRVKRTKFPNM